jgi:uncharacterized membrane protein
MLSGVQLLIFAVVYAVWGSYECFIFAAAFLLIKTFIAEIKHAKKMFFIIMKSTNSHKLIDGNFCNI